jgi:hypothetical protein
MIHSFSQKTPQLSINYESKLLIFGCGNSQFECIWPIAVNEFYNEDLTGTSTPSCMIKPGIEFFS